jgi:hypothetical protein
MSSNDAYYEPFLAGYVKYYEYAIEKLKTSRPHLTITIVRRPAGNYTVDVQGFIDQYEEVNSDLVRLVSEAMTEERLAQAAARDALRPKQEKAVSKAGDDDRQYSRYRYARGRR